MTAGGIDQLRVDRSLVRALLAEQFPQWQHLPIRPVRGGGKDHRMFRLGSALCVRLPSAAEYVPQVAKEQAWLPRLAPQLPLPIPSVLGSGRPSQRFPAPWSVYGWLPGEPAGSAPVADVVGFAADLAGFLVALRSAETAGAPGPGLHSAFRGGPLEHWHEEVMQLLSRLHGRERNLAAGIWREALDASFSGPPQWFHGDVSANNLLVRGGALGGVIDFGCSGVGDASCDTPVLWTCFTGDARAVFRREFAMNDATWARGRGWALWKALIMLTNPTPGEPEFARHVLGEVFAGVRR